MNPEKNSDHYNYANTEADRVVDRHICKEIVQHVNCGCHSCMVQANSKSKDWMFGNTPEDIVKWYGGGNE